MNLEDACWREVEGLHRFFEAWFRGTAEEAEFTRLEEVLAPEFLLVCPRGTRTEREFLLPKLKRLHGGEGAGTEPFTIEVRGYEARVIQDTVCLATYQEWQGSRGRVSTALFRAREGTPHGVEWVHLQETWLPEEKE